jgi:VIT1/CCC1 family predicted Fe2+/Mn2+ transporter
MKHSFKTGLSFGLTSGVITTLGLIVGLHSGTHSKIAVIGGVLTIAIADAFSDALGIHIAEEAKNNHTATEIWESTIFTFLFKFFTALTFIIPIILFPIGKAIIIGIIWGMALLGIFSLYIAKGQDGKKWKIVAEHLTIALIVIIIAHFAGDWIDATFNN